MPLSPQPESIKAASIRTDALIYPPLDYLVMLSTAYMAKLPGALWQAIALFYVTSDNNIKSYLAGG